VETSPLLVGVQIPHPITTIHCVSPNLETLFWLRAIVILRLRLRLRRELRNLAQHCNLDDVEDVKRCVTEKQAGDGFKSSRV